MAAGQDVEISLGTGRLLGLFFAFVVVCGVFFGLGYTLGRSVAPAAVTAETAQPMSANAAKPKGSGVPEEATNAPSTSDLTFYKTVEQKDANPQLVPASTTPTSAPAGAPGPDSPHTSAYVVQVAAVSKKEDAEALAAVLRKKNYPVFLASSAPGDSLFHVQVGPFNDFKDAEAMRGKLAADGYSPIVKK